MDWIRIKSDKGNFVGMVLLDLQKAFDTVNHQILLQKLQAIGVNNSSLQWFQGYLSGRTQLVDIAGTYSPLKAVTCGVPQGSILGPLLFSIYVNDLPSVVACKVLLYADDTALIVSGMDIHEIEQTLATELKCVRDWLIDNKLSLHLGKTESILFGTKQKLNKQGHVNLNITCAGNIIQSKSQVKYLGVELDQFLSGDCITTKIVGKSIENLNFYTARPNILIWEQEKHLFPLSSSAIWTMPAQLGIQGCPKGTKVDCKLPKTN